MKKKIVILGAGGHARTLHEAIQLSGFACVGFVAPEQPAMHQDAIGRYLGNDLWLSKRDPHEFELGNGIGGVGPMGARAHTFERFHELGFEFRTTIHPSAVISPRATVGEGTFLSAGCIVQGGANIGRNCIVNTGAIVDHDVCIEDHAQVAPGAVLAANVVLGKGAFVGVGATIIQGVCVGASSQIAAGAVVVRSVSANSLVLGVPAREDLRGQTRKGE